MSCTVKDLYKSVRKCPGERVNPGMRPYAYFINNYDVALWPSIPKDLKTGDTDMSSLAVLTENFTLKADKCWHRIDLKDLASKFTSETQGEAPSATFLNHGEFVVGGTGANIAGFASVAINDSLVWLVPQRDGRFRLIGSESFETKTTVSMDSGAGVTDNAQATVNVECPDLIMMPFYEGEIVTDEKEGDEYVKISGRDGSVITTTS